jgi:hypothetical protein
MGVEAGRGRGWAPFAMACRIWDIRM